MEYEQTQHETNREGCGVDPIGAEEDGEVGIYQPNGDGRGKVCSGEGGEVMGYSFERGYFKKEYTNVCKSDRCGKPFTTQWKIKKFCSPICLQRGQYLRLKARQQALGLNTRRIPKRPGIRLGMTPEEALAWGKEVRRETNRKHKIRINAECKADPRKGWEKRIREKYKITASDYFVLSENQGNKCALCDKPRAHDDLKVLHVDHCHTSGKVRGLLCFNCNAMLGHAKDRTEVLKRAIEYLEKHNDV